MRLHGVVKVQQAQVQMHMALPNRAVWTPVQVQVNLDNVADTA